MQVRVSTNTEAAIRAGIEPVKGSTYVEVNLAHLTLEQREELSKFNQEPGTLQSGWTLHLESGTATEEAVIKTLQSKVERRTQEEAKKAREIEARFIELLQMSQEEFNEASLYSSASEKASEDPRLAEKMARRQAYREGMKRLEEEKRNREQAEAERSRAAARAQSEAAQAQAEAERLEWIEAHGSTHLKKAHLAGYTCKRLYATERAALEFPGFTIDFDDLSDWKERSCPSEKALDLEATLKASWPFINISIVWLTHPAYKEDEDDYEPWKPREALAIRGYLGKYDLVREM